MTFTILKEKEFKKFLDNSNEKTFLQTPSIAHLREKEGWTPYYLGVKENNKIICATMIVSKKRHFGKYEFYAPRGFLIDYKNYELLKYFTEEIKKFVKKNNGYIFRIDPYVINIERDIDGNIKENGINNKEIIDNLKRLGYKKEKEEEQVVWMFCLDLDTDEETLLKNMRSFTRRNITKALNNSLRIRELEFNELQTIKDLTDATSERKGFPNRNLKYFERMYEVFKPNNEINNIVCELDTKKYILNKEKEIKEQEKRLEELNKLGAKQEKIDKVLKDIDKLKEEKKEVETLRKEKGDFITLSGGVFITYGDEIIYLFGGNYKEYMHFASPYMVQWEMITRGLKNNKKYRRYNFYGIPKNINTHPEGYGIYDFKKGYTGYVEELIGEYSYKTSIVYDIMKLIKLIRK